jgi:signal transduction histidine kinase
LKKLFCLSLFCSFFSASSLASVPIILSDSVQTAAFKGVQLDYLEDPSNSLTFSDIQHGFLTKFKTANPDEMVNNTNIKSTYWVRLTVNNQCTVRKKWVIELFDFKIDHFEAYLPNDTGGYDKFTGGAQYDFQMREYKHKNFVLDLFDLAGGPRTLYYKIKASRRIVFFGLVRSEQKFLEYSNMEYFLLSLFYGIIIAMIIYNFFLFISTLDKAYFYYVLYVTSIGMLALTKDGLGFQYIWGTHPGWNGTIPIISSYSLICWALIYSKTFLNTKTFLPLLDKGIIVLLIVRSGILIASFYFPVIAMSTWVDIIPLVYIYVLGVVSLSFGYRMARFYILAFTLFFIGYTLSLLNQLQLIHSHPLIIYGFNIGVLCEMLLLSLALADRIKLLTFEKEGAQREMIIQSKENENLKDKINLELESKVLERTIELEEKNKELDSFVYRSSHDIKGPLKSIIGLTSIGLSDVKDEAAKKYFDHILKSSRRLDTVVDHLLKVMETKESKIQISKINFEDMIASVVSSLAHLPCFPMVKTEIHIQQDLPFYSDEKLLHSVIYNLVENSLKYCDTCKETSCLKVNICVKERYSLLEISDNGLGIEKKLQEKIFDMFYKINPESSGSGLGLYMTKMYVEKLSGNIILNSKVGQGVSFNIKLKNLSHVLSTSS